MALDRMLAEIELVGDCGVAQSIRHQRENPKKCSILPLRGRPDLVFHNYPMKQPPELTGYVRLAVDGPPLSAADAGQGLLLLDASWRWAEAMTRDFAHVPPRSLAWSIV